MKATANISAFIIILIIVSLNSYCQTTDTYKVKLSRDNEEELILYDTIIHLDYLLQDTKNYNGISNFEFFQRFDYPILKCSNINSEKLIISNDTIEILIETKSFDTLRFKRNLRTDPDYYIKHPFYGLDDIDLTDETKYLPQRELSKITITINKISKELPYTEYENFFNPNIDCKEDCKPTKGYITENGEIIIQMDNSDGAGFYYAIFIFDYSGNLKRKLVENVL